MIPEDIAAAKYVNVILGVLLLIGAALPLWIVGTAIYYDGIASVFGWPVVFWVMSAIGGVLVFFGLRLLLAQQRVGANVRFSETGFDVSVRQYLRRPKAYLLTWRDIEEMRLIEAPRGGDVLAFRLTPDAAEREGVAGYPHRGEATLPLGLCEPSISDVVSRFESSAKAAGAELELLSSFNVVVLVRKVWAVRWT
ncbi:MAG: hypothetical protein QNJ20_12470 [Paracoccaceae bacterium]|nr:hypothetical protein [Paracoccaceae bacterium]